MIRPVQANTFRMTYELAAKLRGHGYPQPIHNAELPGGVFYSKPSRAYGPSFAELFKTLGAMGDLDTVDRVGPKRWIAESKSGTSVSGSTALEALANLWCALNKKKIKRKNSR